MFTRAYRGVEMLQNRVLKNDRVVDLGSLVLTLLVATTAILLYANASHAETVNAPGAGYSDSPTGYSGWQNGGPWWNPYYRYYYQSDPEASATFATTLAKTGKYRVEFYNPYRRSWQSALNPNAIYEVYHSEVGSPAVYTKNQDATDGYYALLGEHCIEAGPARVILKHGTTARIPTRADIMRWTLVEELPNCAPVATHTINALAGLNGTIVPGGSVSVIEGSDQSFNIYPDAGYQISSVLADGEDIGIATEVTFSTVREDHQLEASFSPILFTINAAAGSGGSISPAGDVSVAFGQDQSFTITPDDGYYVADILVAGESVIDTLAVDKEFTFFDVQQNQDIEVIFTEGYEIRVLNGGNGDVVPDGGDLGLVKVAKNANVSFAFLPDSCYEVASVYVDGEEITEAGSGYDFVEVKKNHVLAVDFVDSTGNIEIVATAGSFTTISPDGVIELSCGTPEMQFTVTYNDALEDLYLVVNEENIQILAAGVEQGSAEGEGVDFGSNGDNEFTFTLTDIIENYRIDLSEVFNISDFPLDIQTRPAPPNIMFVLDDSGSMDWEFMTNQNNGVFSNIEYIFDDPGNHNNYQSGSFNDILGRNDSDQVDNVGELKRWKSQWFAYNKMYYNPSLEYRVWPGKTADDTANSAYVRYHPDLTSGKLDLSAKFVDIGEVRVPNAHYYVTDADGKPYLVYLDYSEKEIYYFEVSGTSNGDGSNQQVSQLTLDEDPPAEVATSRNFADEFQNFANWYTFHRKRSSTATYAVASVAEQVNNAYLGLRSINYSPGQSKVALPLTPIEVLYLNENGEYVYEDDTDLLLENIYNYSSHISGGTPLRKGLEAVGKYYDRTDIASNGDLSGDPWFPKELGGECQESFTIAMTDGYYNQGDPSVGNADGNKGQPYADTFTNTLADVAQYYLNYDLVPDDVLGDKVPGEFGYQHMKTYGVAFGVRGTLTDDDYTLVPGCTTDCNYPVWPNPSNSNLYKIDDLFHAAVNGRGLYLNASNPQELIDSVLEAVEDIIAAEGSAASASVNGDELFVRHDTQEIFLYQSRYNSPGWWGTVLGYSLDFNEDGSVIPTKVWDANEKLKAALLVEGTEIYNGDSRIIATLRNEGTPAGVPFRLSELSSNQQAFFDNDVGSRQDLFDYIRGSNVKESSTEFRVREGRIADIVNSSAMFNDEYLYVGTNGGMMHALDALTGEVKFSYVPALVMQNLKYLAQQNYGNNHRFFVNNSPYTLKMRSTAVDADDPTYNSSKTYLVGGLGKGGKGYYALDITNQKEISTEDELAERVLWEYPQDDTPPLEYADDLGYSFARAYIVKSNGTGSAVSTGDSTLDKYMDGHVVVFGNGYGSANGDAVLYIVNAHTGTLIRKINVGGGPGNGLSTTAIIDVNNDYKMDYIYAGDLKGNLWKFDLTSEDPDEWQVAFCDDGLQKGNSSSCIATTSPKPLFKTRGSQPITSRPDITRHISGNGYMVIFGTGRFIGELDWKDTSTQAFYGIWDFGDDGDDGEYLGEFKADGTLANAPANVDWGLLEQTVLFEGDVSLNEKGEEISEYVRVISQNKANWATVNDRNSIPDNSPLADPDAHLGWYFELPLDGERVTNNALIRDGKAVMVSFVLDDNRCSGGAESFVHELDVYTGGRLDRPAFDINSDGKVGEGDKLARGEGGTEGLGNEGDVGDDDYYPASAVKKSGRLESPVIVEKDPGDRGEKGTEIKIFSSSDGTLQTVVEEREQQGLIYWREY